MTPSRTLLAAFALLAPHATLADDAGLLKCRAIAEPAARLACYDALAAGVRSPAAAPPVVAAAPATQFGLQPKPTPAEEVQAIESYIPGRFEGWRYNTRITLANGQVWQVAEDGRVFIDKTDPKVSIRRGLMGAFYLEIEGRNGSTRVRRVQ